MKTKTTTHVLRDFVEGKQRFWLVVTTNANTKLLRISSSVAKALVASGMVEEG